MTGNFSPAKGRQPSIEWVPIAELHVDLTYQRSIESAASQKLIRSIAAEWDWDVLDVLKVSRRPDDRMFLVDGQHRRAAAELRGDIAQLPCVLKRCAGPAEEARLFIAANRSRRAMTRVDDFRAAVGAGDAEALAVQRCVDAAALTIARQATASAAAAGELYNVSALRNALRKHGEDALAAVLRVIGEAFPDEVLANPSAFVGALLELRDLDPDRLFTVLLTGTTAQWAEWAKLKGVAGFKQTWLLRDLIRQRYLAAERKAA
jgi:hypothetical protein